MANGRDPRAPRSTDMREDNARPSTWKDPGLLPDPEPMAGYTHRWIRTATLGNADPTNVSTRFREGWAPVPKEEVEHLGLMQDHRTRFPANMEVGGLLLCRMPTERAEERTRHFEQMAANQVRSSDHNFMKQSDPRMPVLKPERTTTTTWGSGRPQR